MSTLVFLLPLLLSAPFIVLMARRPVLRRLALRYASRRPLEALLVLVGSLLGTAILTGSLLVGDTLDSSLRRQARIQLGDVDEMVVPFNPGDGQGVQQRLTALRHEDIDGVLPVTTAFAACATVAEPRRAEPRCQLLEVDFAAARSFGGESDTGLDGATPAPGTAAVSADVAQAIGVRAGDSLALMTYGRATEVRIDRVLRRQGLAMFWDGPEAESLNVFLAPGTLATSADGLAGPGGPQPAVLVSNRGGAESGASRTEAVTEVLEAAAAAPVDVRALKKQRLDAADQSGAQFASLLAAMGIFGVVAGILLLVNVFVMLADERRSELAMMRALGMRRSTVVAAFATEGWLYSLIAAALGTASGFLLGRVIVAAVAPIFAGGLEGLGLELSFAAERSSLLTGFTAGFVIALTTVVATSVRISRLNIIAAIRGLEDLPAAASRRIPVGVIGGFATAAGAVWTAVSLSTNNGYGLLLAPLLLVAGAVALARRSLQATWLTSAGAAAALVWGTVGFTLAVEPGSGPGGGVAPAVFVLQGLVLTAAAVVLFSENQRRTGDVLRRLAGGRGSLALHLGLAHPLDHRFRTGMILAMYSLVVFTLTFLSVFGHVFSSQIDSLASRFGSFDIITRSSSGFPVTAEQLAEHPQVSTAAPLWAASARVVLPGEPEARSVSISAYDERWIDLGPPELIDPGRYRSGADAFRAVLTDPSLILIDPLLFGAGGTGDSGMPQGPPSMSALGTLQVGDLLKVIDPLTGREREVEVAAFVGSGLTGAAAYYGLPAARELLGDRLLATRAFLDVEGDAEQVATELAGAYVANGLVADAVSQLLDQVRAATVQFLQVLRSYLALGLVVGVAGLAVVMVRAVRERRREIGVLRALGFQPATVRRSFIIESAFMACEGVVIGVALALVTSYTLVANAGGFTETLRWVVPVGTLALLVLGTLFVSLLATVAPAQLASRVRPAVALRIAD